MEKSVIDLKNELIEWIESTYDSERLQQMLEIKNCAGSSSLIANINSETVIQEDFDQQFAAGMTSDELLENIAAHIKTINSEGLSS